MRIAFLGLRSIGPFASGGIEKAIEALSTRYVKLGHEVTVFCRRRYHRDVGNSFQGVRLRVLPAIYSKHLEAISHTALAIIYSLRGYDVIHVNATGPALLTFIPRIFGKNVVVTVHGLDWKRDKWGTLATGVLRLGARAAAAFPQRTIVVSRTLQRHYKDLYDKDVSYIPNGVSIPSADSSPQAHLPPGIEKGRYILFLSRLVPEKGCHTLIKAFRNLPTDMKLVIAGAPSHSDAYAASLHGLAGDDDRIVFAGPVYGAAKEALYRDAYLFVLPSTIEGMALVLLEAMSHGKCVLCSDIEENMEVIYPLAADTAYELEKEQERQLLQNPTASDSHKLGFSFSTEDVEDLTLRLQFLISQPGIVRRIGHNVRERVAKEYDWDNIAQRYLGVYDSLTARG